MNSSASLMLSGANKPIRNRSDRIPRTGIACCGAFFWSCLPVGKYGSCYKIKQLHLKRNAILHSISFLHKPPVHGGEKPVQHLMPRPFGRRMSVSHRDNYLHADRVPTVARQSGFSFAWKKVLESGKVAKKIPI